MSGCFTYFPQAFGHISPAFLFLTPSQGGKDSFLQSFVPIVNLDGKLIKLLFALHLAEHGSDLSTVCDTTAIQNHLTPSKRISLLKYKDFSSTGQLGLCNTGKEGQGLLDISRDQDRHCHKKQYTPDQNCKTFFHFPNPFKDRNS